MKPKILMIDHDTDDRFLTNEMFQMNGFDAEIDFIDSAYFLNYTRDTNSRPQLILIDRNTRPGRFTDVIKQIRSTKGFEFIPLIILSDTARPEDVQDSYSLGANSFIKKPSDYQGTIFKIKSFIDYWFQSVELPVE